jgi:hypothetical protein
MNYLPRRWSRLVLVRLLDKHVYHISKPTWNLLVHRMRSSQWKNNTPFAQALWEKTEKRGRKIYASIFYKKCGTSPAGSLANSINNKATPFCCFLLFKRDRPDTRTTLRGLETSCLPLTDHTRIHHGPQASQVGRLRPRAAQAQHVKTQGGGEEKERGIRSLTSSLAVCSRTCGRTRQALSDLVNHRGTATALGLLRPSLPSSAKWA